MIRPSSLRPVLTPDRVAGALVALIPLIYFFPAVFGDLVLAPDDGLLFNVPLRTAAAQLIHSGTLPLWNPYIFSGMPLHASVQGGLLFPLNWWFLLFNPATAANLMVLSTYALAGLGAYLYARKAGASIGGAILTGVIWQLGGCMVGQVSHINIAQTSAMLPWVLWTIDNFGVHGRRKWGVAVAVAVGLQVFVGHPQTLVYALMLTTAYVLVMGLTHTEFRTRYFTCLLFVVAGLSLAAIQILPTFELLRNSIRSDTTYEFFSSFSLPGRSIQMFVAPYILGGGDGRLFRAPYIGPPYYAEFVPYVGVVAIMLSIMVLVIRRDVCSIFWGVVAVVAFVLALGDNAPFGINYAIYHLPLLKLFRVPARHLLEVDFALAVLAGRGLTILGSSELTKKNKLAIAAACGGVLAITILVVTVGRPANFRLGREAAVSILRAPELFMPIVVALVSALAVWCYARRKTTSAAVVVLLVVLLDLTLWGQFSGWINSPRRANELWHTPESVKVLRELTKGDFSSYRVLTAPHTFDPNAPPVPPSVSHSSEWSLWTQPDPYMMHGVRNAGGYDGFGLQRYGRLAGDMKVWGELTDPDSTLRGPSREIDILNVRYLVSMRGKSEPVVRQLEKGTQKFGEALFGATDLGLSNVTGGSALRFKVDNVVADQVALVTNMSWSQVLPDGSTVARLRLFTQEGQSFEFPVKVGVDTAEWAHDRPDINAVIKHKRAPVAASYRVVDANGSYEGHTYVRRFQFPKEAAIASGELVLEPNSLAPQLTISLFRLSLGQGSDFYAVGKDSFTSGPVSTASPIDRWKLAGQTEAVDIYENTRVLPKVWLAAESRVLNEDQMLRTIRTSQLPDGSAWDPLRTALLESDAEPAGGPSGQHNINVTRYEANRIDVDVNLTSPGILVLSENHYPGWRAYVDDQNVDVMRVNYNLRGVMLLPGQHKVQLLYRPKSVYIGFGVSLLTAILLAAWWAGIPRSKNNVQ